MAGITTFRIHFDDGGYADIAAADPAAARASARLAFPDRVISKVKVLKGETA